MMIGELAARAEMELPISYHLERTSANLWRTAGDYKRGGYGVPETIHEFSFSGYTLCVSGIIIKNVKNFQILKS